MCGGQAGYTELCENISEFKIDLVRLREGYREEVVRSGTTPEGSSPIGGGIVTRKRFALVVGLVLGVLTAVPAAEAQSSPKTVRIGYLEFGSAAPGTPLLEAFRRGLNEYGWIEGQNITIEVRYAEGRQDRLPGFAADLVGLKVDIIFASTTPAALAAKQATTTVPIVIGFVADPVGSGLVPRLARPGGNITGWTHLAGVELNAKRLEILKEAVPEAGRIAALWNPANPIHGPSLKVIEAAARQLKVQLHAMAVRDPEDLQGAFSAMTRERVQALTVPPDGMFLAHQARIIDLAATHRIPTMYGVRELAGAGGLMAYGVNLPEMYRHGAFFVDRILKGAKPGDLPVERPTKFELIINLKTAKALALPIPQSLLLRADQLID
jgi:putative ABC transport system substrate-binding protein